MSPGALGIIFRPLQYTLLPSEACSGMAALADQSLGSNVPPPRTRTDTYTGRGIDTVLHTHIIDIEIDADMNIGEYKQIYIYTHTHIGITRDNDIDLDVGNCTSLMGCCGLGYLAFQAGLRQPFVGLW